MIAQRRRHIEIRRLDINRHRLVGHRLSFRFGWRSSRRILLPGIGVLGSAAARAVWSLVIITHAAHCPSPPTSQPALAAALIHHVPTQAYRPNDKAVSSQTSDMAAHLHERPSWPRPLRSRENQWRKVLPPLQRVSTTDPCCQGCRPSHASQKPVASRCLWAITKSSVAVGDKLRHESDKMRRA